MLFLALGRPRRIDVGEIVVGPRRFALERARRPHARKRPAIEIRCRRHDDGLGCRHGDQVVALDECRQLVDVLTRGADKLARRRMFGLRPGPRLERIAAVQTAGERPERFLRGLQLAHPDRQQPIDGNREAFFELQLLLEFLAAESKRGARPRRDIGFQVLDVRADRL